jgi:tetratricopeptide (TPR) repeat protein
LNDCVEWCQRVVEGARASGALPELANGYYLLHIAYTSLCSPERVRVRDLALPIYEELGDLLGQANALNNLGIDAYYEGRWDEALAFYERSRNARERIGDVVGAATIANNIAEIYSDQGRIVEAEELFRRVLATCESAGASFMIAAVTSNLGRAAARAGRFDEARRLLTAALDALREVEAVSFVHETQVRFAEAAALSGNTEEAWAAAAGVDELGDGTSTPSVQALLHRVRASVHAQRGEQAEAEHELERSLEIAQRNDALYEVALTLDVRARLRSDAALAAEARRLLDALHVVVVRTPPLG